MSIGLRLSDYATSPLYNIKAVVQATGISPSTLRAWERRYNMCRPQRSESGYRLYAERDIAIIRWLKSQVDAGMSISQAVSWLEKMAAEAGGVEHVILPGSTAMAPAREVITPTHRGHVRDFASLQAELLCALLEYDEGAAEQVMAEAFALYPVERIGENLILPVLIEIGERWHQGKVSVAAEHFATNYLLQRLAALLRSLPNGSNGPLVWVGCAPSELHEGGALLLGIYLRRAGYRVHYLGQSLPAEGLAAEVDRRQPAMILLSASTEPAAEELAKLTEHLAHSSLAHPIIGYGGQVFTRHPELRAPIVGLYLGDNAHSAVDQVNELLTNRLPTRSSKAPAEMDIRA